MLRPTDRPATTASAGLSRNPSPPTGMRLSDIQLEVLRVLEDIRSRKLAIDDSTRRHETHQDAL